MPKTGLKHTGEMTTRNSFTKVDVEIGMTVDGRELPTMATLGAAFEQGIALIQAAITKSYEVVPPRT